MSGEAGADRLFGVGGDDDIGGDKGPDLLMGGELSDDLSGHEGDVRMRTSG